jgi:protein-S-isoprenylcysteine O-methyltransferase Ste14
MGRSLELRIPPPLVALAVAVLMWGLAGITPTIDLAADWVLILGVAPAMLGVGAAIAGVASFQRARTTIHPLTPERSSALVDSGIYRFSRNPMYLGMALVLLGWSAWLTAPAALFGPLIFMAFITRFQIHPEERILEGLFGEGYKDYCRRVRRWL